MRLTRELFKIKSGVLFFIRQWQNEEGRSHFVAHHVSVSPAKAWESFLHDLYDDNARMLAAVDTRSYDGTVLDRGEAFEIGVNDRKVKGSCCDFLDALSKASVEHRAEDVNPNATVIRGYNENGDEVVIVIKHSPLMRLTHRFMRADHVYKAITDPVLTLSTKIDAVIVSGKLVFLTIAGAQMFVSESICRNIASEKIEEIRQVKYLAGMDHFEDVALKGVNVRRFLGYNEQRVVDLKRAVCREKIANKFGIAMKGNKLDLTNPDDADRFIRVVCNRGMLDPFDDKAVEVSSSKPWEKKRK